MKACVIIGNPSDQEDESLRYNNYFPAILHLLDTYKVDRLYLTLCNAIERIAAIELAHSRWTSPKIKLVFYQTPSSSVFLYKQIPNSQCEVSTWSRAEILRHVTHLLTVDYELPYIPTMNLARFQLSGAELCAVSDDTIRKIAEWAQEDPSPTRPILNICQLMGGAL